MATWTGQKVDKSNINGGNQFGQEGIAYEDVNAVVNNSIYASEFVDAMTAEGGANVGNVGTPSVSFNAQTKKFTFNYLKGQKGDTGNDGRGITSISKTGTSGLVDTYTINYSNNTTSTFTVTNGQNGTNGTNGQDGAAAIVNGSASNTITFSLSNNNTVLNIIVG